ncbi:MAG: hypothetical protein KDH20_11155 [Rhodocyclaceae bacterium]|nr:hypothetical protein [Rhodocyclaceae bacterium]
MSRHLSWRRALPGGLAALAGLGIIGVLAVPFVAQVQERRDVAALVARFEGLQARLQQATRDGPVASCDDLQRTLEGEAAGEWRILDVGFQLLPGSQQGAYRPVATVCAAATDPEARAVARAARARFGEIAALSAPANPRDTVTSYMVALSPPGRVGCLGHPTLPPRPCAGVPPLPGRSQASRQMLMPN